MSRRPDRDPEDAWHQDRYVSQDEERFAAEMGQPSDLSKYSLEDTERLRRRQESPETQERGLTAWRDEAAVLCQSSVRCNRCDRMTVPMEDVLSLDSEGNWVHAECGDDG